MLKLKRVEIQGFKSFYDRTEMKFKGTGIAAIVGPNGCGKSNLSDAISWVLGEQSAKTLRGSRMEDVIFAGTRDRKPLGMATVTMTLVPDEAAPAPTIELNDSEAVFEAPSDSASDASPAVHLNGFAHANGHAEHAPLDDPRAQRHQTPVRSTEAAKTAERQGEITITRRLYRSGESEYLINGRIARLRDIQDLFFGTGLGPESYAIIEQGRIGQILSNKPQDRRNVIEEAAGVTKFKARKRLAEAKLESAKQNLSRVFDILEEVTRQVNSLKRQAAKTRRYAELKSEATGYLRQVLAARFRMLERETAKLAIELNLATAALDEAQAAITARETDEAAVLEASYANEERLTDARRQLADLHLEAERARSQIEYQLKQIQQIEQRLASGAQETQALETQQHERSAELERQTAELETLEADCAAEREHLEAKSAEREEAQKRLSDHEQALEAARQEVIRLMGESSGLKNRITHADAQLGSIDRDAARAQAEEQQSQADLARLKQLKAQLSERLSARQTELVSLTDQRNILQQELNEKRAALNESRQALDRLRAECSRIKARKDSLEEVIQHRSYTTETVKRLFTAVERGKAPDLRPIGVLADFLEVDPQFEKAAEEFLHDELEYVVVRDWSEADRGIELMRTEVNGRATFLVENTSDSSGFSTDLPRPGTEAGTLSRLTDALRLTNGLASIPLHLLPRISYCYIAADRGIARHMAARFPHCWFLSTDGVNYHGQAVSGGKKTGAGPLALKRELREVAQLEQVKGSELSAAQAGLVELEHAIAALAEELEDVRSRQQAQEKDVLALDHESRKLAEEFQRSQARLSNARLELDKLSSDRVKLKDSAEHDRSALAECEQLRGEQECALESARHELAGMQAEVARAAEEHSTLRASLASLEERRRSLASDVARLQSQVRDAANRQAHLAQETDRLTAEREQFVASNSELETKSAELKHSIETTEANVNQLAQHESDLRARLAAADEALKELRQRAQLAQERRSELQVSLARAESDLKHLDETCQNELDTTLAQLVEGIETVADEETIQDLEGRYAELRRKIEALGPVNPQALEEYEEAQQRQDFLSAQRQDLLDSIRDTEKLIHQVDEESRKRFTEAFHAINANFREMFKVLFSGGVGEMRLTDEENVAESGIDIVASPPGKKLQSVLLLSGGEKSLTAMALLMATFQYTPSPFCILDEVDAPLDEPNIERLTRLLRDMAGQTQFIVITHAKRTMEAAQSLYGVTMQEPGVSKLVSVKFDEVKQDRQRRLEAPAAEQRDLESAIA